MKTDETFDGENINQKKETEPTELNVIVGGRNLVKDLEVPSGTDQTVVPAADLMMQVVKKDGLSDDLVQSIANSFLPVLEKIDGWAAQAESLKISGHKDFKNMKAAREMRLAIKDHRVGADKLRKGLKKDALAYLDAVQAAYNMLEDRMKPIEAGLKDKETVRERYQAQLQGVRMAEIEPYKDLVPAELDVAKLYKLNDKSWAALLTSLQDKLAEKISQEAKEREEERLRREELEKPGATEEVVYTPESDNSGDLRAVKEVKFADPPDDSKTEPPEDKPEKKVAATAEGIHEAVKSIMEMQGTDLDDVYQAASIAIPYCLENADRISEALTGNEDLVMLVCVFGTIARKMQYVSTFIPNIVLHTAIAVANLSIFKDKH